MSEDIKMKKRIVIGNWVHNRDFSNRRYVNARRLCELYGFNPKECILAEMNRLETLLGLDSIMPRYTVRYDGDYK